MVLKRATPAWRESAQFSTLLALRALAPSLSPPVEPPGKNGEREEGPRRQKQKQVGPKRAEPAEVLEELRSFLRRPRPAVALLHEQRHQPLTARELRKDSVSFPPNGLSKPPEPFPEERRLARMSHSILRHWEPIMVSLIGRTP